jgi:hypothetical protein
VLATCAQLRAAGADEPADKPHDAALARAVLRVEDELVELLDTGFRDAVAAALAGSQSDELGALLHALTPSLAAIDDVDAALVGLGGKSGLFKARIVGPRVEALVRSAFDRVEGRDRLELIEQVAALVVELDRSGLKAAMPPPDLLRLAAGALVRSERTAPPLAEPTPDHDGYRALRASSPRVSLTYTIVELALHAAPDRPLATDAPGELVKALGGLVGALPAALRAEIVDLDLGRVERSVALVREWWRSLAPVAEAARASGETARLGSALTQLKDSRFFHVTRDEGALLRFALECRVIGEIFPEADHRAAALRAEIDATEAESSAALNALRRGRADAGWSELLSPSRSMKGA